jgi:acyl-CoA thioester hydrolase
MTEFIFPIRVYYEDTDSGGVVYYANYLKFMERARSEYLRSLGFEQDEIIANDGVLFAVRSLSVDYVKPARFNQLLNVSAQLAEIGKASLLFAQRVELAAGEASQLFCTAKVKIACLDARTFRPTPIPSRILREVTSER